LQLPEVDPARLAVAIRSVLAEDRAQAQRLGGDAIGARNAPALFELGYLAASVDGLDDTERAAMVRLLQTLDETLETAALEQQLAELDTAIENGARAELLRLAAADIVGAQREAALAFAAGIAMADGWLGGGELEALGEVASALGLSEDRAHELIQDLVHRVEARLG
jgi:tellurite resistance protein